MSGGTIEIITGRERRRRWSLEEKLRIVAETDEPGARVTEVAARHWMYPGLLFTWRRQVRDGVLVAPAATFVLVRMLPSEFTSGFEARHAANDQRGAPEAETSRRSDMIEITLLNGCRLCVDQHVDTRALRRIVGVLRG